MEIGATPKSPPYDVGASIELVFPIIYGAKDPNRLIFPFYSDYPCEAWTLGFRDSDFVKLKLNGFYFGCAKIPKGTLLSCGS